MIEKDLAKKAEGNNILMIDHNAIMSDYTIKPSNNHCSQRDLRQVITM